MKTVTIEELLSWAFVHELPKGGGMEGLANVNSAWALVSGYAELMAKVDRGSGPRGPGGDPNYFIEQGEPAEDALTVGSLVGAFRRCDIVVPGDWNPLSDWTMEGDVGHLAEAAVATVVERFMGWTVDRRREHLVALVVGTAILGREPDWQAEQPKVRMVERNGKPAWFVTRELRDTFGRVQTVEVDGYNPKSQRPVRGAYRRYEFSDSPIGDIMGRLDYQLWVAALARLHRLVLPELVAHRLMPLDRHASPWKPDVPSGIVIAETAPLKKSA